MNDSSGSNLRLDRTINFWAFKVLQQSSFGQANPFYCRVANSFKFIVLGTIKFSILLKERIKKSVSIDLAHNIDYKLTKAEIHQKR